jgi:hypothetical protein
MNFRLTVHVENQPRVDTKPSNKLRKKGEQKNAIDQAREQAAKERMNKNAPQETSKGRYKVFTTLSSYHKTKEDCMKELSEIRTKYDIAIGKDINKPNKFDKELWQISWVN